MAQRILGIGRGNYPRKLRDFTGQTFGDLTPISFVRKSGKDSIWLCQCSCGNVCEKNLSRIARCTRMARHCGCKPRANEIHGLTNSPTYHCWEAMMRRCYNRRDVKSFRFYGAKGVKVCERWHKFAGFFEDMGIRPSNEHTVDRIDGKKGYEPGNCRWLLKKNQHRNKSSNRLITFGGKTQCLVAWIEESGLPASTIHNRLRHGWSFERAFTTPHLKPSVLTD